MSTFGKSQVEMFFYRLFGDPVQRRHILLKWQSQKPRQKEEVSLSKIFETFIITILYEPVSFHMFADYFTVVGDLLPIRYEWITSSDRETVISMFAARSTLFRIKKEYQNNQFDLNTFTFEGEARLFDYIWRRQIVRDFVWMAASKNSAYIVLALIIALQSILLIKQGDVFLSAIHDALQGKSTLAEVLAWDNSAYDIHPEILLYTTRPKVKKD